MAAALLAVAAAVAGVVRLFQLRFEAGDIYPPYSTLRSDPLGAKAFHEALGSMGGATVERSITPILRVRPDSLRDGTFFILGARGSVLFSEDSEPGPLSFPVMVEQEAVRLEAIAAAGTRVVIALDASSLGIFANADFRRIYQDRRGGDADPTGSDEAGPSSAGDGQEQEEAPTDAGADRADDDVEDPGATDSDRDERAFLPERWGFRLGIAPESETAGEDGKWPVEAAGELADRGIVPPAWFSPVRFAAVDDSWEVLAVSGGAPVVMRRAFGEGEIILASDAYFASNEALWDGAATGFLVWTTGGRARIVFDETHHAVMGDPGIMGLVRRYRLFGFFIGVVVLVALYAWKNASALVPPDVAGEGRLFDGDTVTGNEGSAGLVRLLSRHVPRESLLSTSYRLWYRSASRGRRLTRERADRIIALIEEDEARPRRRRRPVETYNRVAAIINERR